MSNTKKIKVMAIETEEGDNLFRIDDPHAALRFFQYLNDNCDTETQDPMKVKELTAEEWAEAERVGDELA